MSAGGLEIDDLRVEREGRLILAVDRLATAPGTCAVVNGSAGSGKSSFAAALAGSLPATGGVRVDGVDLTGGPAARRRRGLAAALQDGRRLGGCTVEEALALAGTAARSVEEALERFPLLVTRRQLRVEVLSGGEHQALRVACAWIRRAAVLVLDAPTVGLAADVAAAVVDLAISETERGAAVLWLDQPGTSAPAAPSYLIRGSRLLGADPAC